MKLQLFAAIVSIALLAESCNAILYNKNLGLYGDLGYAGGCGACGGLNYGLASQLTYAKPLGLGLGLGCGGLGLGGLGCGLAGPTNIINVNKPASCLATKRLLLKKNLLDTKLKLKLGLLGLNDLGLGCGGCGLGLGGCGLKGLGLGGCGLGLGGLGLGGCGLGLGGCGLGYKGLGCGLGLKKTLGLGLGCGACL